VISFDFFCAGASIIRQRGANFLLRLRASRAHGKPWEEGWADDESATPMLANAVATCRP
jgi:hypothetical protein